MWQTPGSRIPPFRTAAVTGDLCQPRACLPHHHASRPPPLSNPVCPGSNPGGPPMTKPWPILFQPGGLPDSSRWLSLAIPPDNMTETTAPRRGARTPHKTLAGISQKEENKSRLRDIGAKRLNATLTRHRAEFCPSNQKQYTPFLFRRQTNPANHATRILSAKAQTPKARS